MSSSISLADDSDRPHPHSKQNPEMYRTVQQKPKTKKEPIVDEPKEKRAKSKSGHSQKKPYTQYKDSTTNEANTLSKTSTNERANAGQIIDKQSSSQPDSMLVPKERRHKSRDRKSGSDNESPR